MEFTLDYHRILNAVLGDLVFGCRMFYPSQTVDKQLILDESLKRKEEQHQKDLKRDNKKRIAHNYAVGDEVYISLPPHELRKSSFRYKGPFKIIEVDHEHQKCYVQLSQTREWFPYERIKPNGERSSGEKPNVVTDIASWYQQCYWSFGPSVSP